MALTMCALDSDKDKAPDTDESDAAKAVAGVFQTRYNLIGITFAFTYACSVESTASLRPQSAKLNAKFLDLTLRPEKKKRGRPTTAKQREVKFSPEYPKRGQLNNDVHEPNATAAALWSDDDDDEGGYVVDDSSSVELKVAAPSCSKLKVIVVQAILQREECLATIVEGCQEGGWRPGNDGISRILPLLAPLRLLSLAVVESILRWKVAADNRAFLWDGASYLHKMTSDTNVLDPFLSLELGFPMRRNPFMSSMALDTPQLTLLVCCPHKQQRTDDVVQCIARRLHFGTLEPGDMALNTRVISAMVAIVKEDMETQLDQEVMLGQTQHKASLDLDMSTISFEPDPEATVATIPTLKQQQQQQQQRQPELSAVYSPFQRVPRDPRNDSATNTSKNSSSFRKLLHPVPTTNETLGRGTSDNDDDVHDDLQRIFSLCNDVSTAASQLKRQLHVLDTATKMDAPYATIFCALEPIPSYPTSPLATPLRRGDLASPSSPIQSTPSHDIISAKDDNLTSYIESLSARIDRLRAFDVGAATDDDYKSLAIPCPFNQQQASVLQRHHTPVIGVAAIPTTGHERCSSTIPGSNRGFIPPLQTKSQRDLQDQYADEGFESEGSARCDMSSTTPHDHRHDAATNAVHTDVKLTVMPYFILWMTNRLRCVQYRDLERRAKRERVRLAYMTWHDESRRIVRVRTAFCGWRDQAQFEKDKRVQTRAEFAQSAKAWKQLQRGTHPSS
ncbi:hypothetical protein DYB35_006024 [Aphanomyces astaci]|uniref:Uncharacterized protein n=1 Tax=Aphanomyces astaci TaxID=112090 RepID=A0A3R6Y081_APHAT|nr:hypothetical protein DYB35_006024 [Aphanomyces astaci]